MNHKIFLAISVLLALFDLRAAKNGRSVFH
jgi:hypothetical protein